MSGVRYVLVNEELKSEERYDDSEEVRSLMTHLLNHLPPSDPNKYIVVEGLSTRGKRIKIYPKEEKDRYGGPRFIFIVEVEDEILAKEGIVFVGWTPSWALELARELANIEIRKTTQGN